MVSTGSRLLGVLLSAVATITMLDVAGAPAAAAAPVPIAPGFGAIIDDYSEYERENTCDPVDKPGPLAVRDLLLDT